MSRGEWPAVELHRVEDPDGLRWQFTTPGPEGRSLEVGLFTSQHQARKYAKRRRWQIVRMDPLVDPPADTPEVALA